MNTNILSMLFCAAALAFAPPSSAAQAPDWQWSAYAGNTAEDIARGVAVDGSGNLYAVGSLQSRTLAMGSIVLDNPGTPKFKLFVAKYDTNGRLVWANSVTGDNDSTARTIAVDAAGNSYVGGYFTGTMVIGPATLVSDNRVMRAFLAKYDTNGRVLWAQSSTGAGGSRLYSTLADPAGNVYLAGTFSKDVTFGATTLNSSDGIDLFLMKLNGNGKVLWATSAGGSAEDTAYTVSDDASGHLYLTGYFFSPEIVFGATKLVNADPTGKTADMFVAKYHQCRSGPVGQAGWWARQRLSDRRGLGPFRQYVRDRLLQQLQDHLRHDDAGERRRPLRRVHREVRHERQPAVGAQSRQHRR